MTTLYNEIMIKATPQTVWKVLSDLGRLEKYDPIVTKSDPIDKLTSGLAARRHCQTRNGWFKEEVSDWQPYEQLAFTLFDCNLPMKALKHSYSLHPVEDGTRVTQVMTYTMKYGLLGRLLDLIMVRKQSDKGIKLFFEGLKQEVENQTL